MFKNTFLIIVAGTIIVSCTPKMAPPPPPPPPPPVPEMPVSLFKNAVDSFSYAVGINIATSMKGQGVPTVNTELMSMAMNSILNGDTTLMNAQEANMTIQEKLQAFMAAKKEADAAKTMAFLTENKARPGVITLDNGLQYEVLKAGDSNTVRPKAIDTVTVHYAGTLMDGTEFDNSMKRGEPATFPLSNVIKGWTEILQLMPVGSKWKVYIPGELGYGERGSGAAIPPNALLIFEIELLAVKPATGK